MFIFLMVPSSRAQFRSTQWTADSGLPENIIRGIIQTPDGYLWVATLNGIARFDGVRFKVFDKSNTPGIAVNRFAAMVHGDGADLWLYTESGAITRYHRNEFHTFGDAEGSPSGSVHGITNDSYGHIWILRDEKIFQWNEGTGRFEPTANGAEVQYRSLNWNGTGFWGVLGQKLYCFVRGKLSIHVVPDYIPLTNVRKVAAGGDGVIWLNLSDGRFGRLFDDKWQLYSEPVQTPLQGTRRSWKARIDNHLDRTLFFPSGGFEKSIHYNIIIGDNEGNTWVGSEDQGLFRIEEQLIHTYSIAQGLAGANIYPILRDRHGDMWIGTWPAGLTRVHDGTVKTYTLKEGLPGLVTALAEDNAGTLWVGTHGGLAVLTQGQIHKAKNVPGDLPIVQAILKLHDGSLLFGTPKGIYKYSETNEGQGNSWLESAEGISIGDVHVIVEGRNGDVWFGGYGGLTRIHNGVMTRFTEGEGLPSNNVRSIYEDSEGVLWIGTYDGGLGRYFNGRWTRYTKEDGLFDNGVFQILEDSQANFWMSSNRGIYRVSKQQLNYFAAGKQRSVITVSYGRRDGMLNAECNGGLWPAGAKDKDGKLWFPTQDGVAIVDPELVSTNKHPPRVSIESEDVDHISTPPGKDIIIKPGQESLEIQYTALSFSRPEQVVFRYKMDGLDTNWQEAGYRRTAYYSHLPPGTYVFQVMAANSDGVWSNMLSTASITVLPPFYLTRWFLATIFAIALGLMYLLWSFRVRQLKEIQAAQQAFSQQLIASQENERRRISGELHDSLGQRLIIIKNHALFLLRPRASAQSEEDRRETIEEINAEASLAIDETRTISYNLRPFQLDRIGLTKAIEALVRSVPRATNIRFITSIADIDASFPEELRINFYRIVQEAINNIMKHSGASEAEVRVAKTNHGILLSIRDNGTGFTSEQKSIGTKGGFGLTGIRERALLLHGTVEIQSQPGDGTLLSINFDLRD
ncbi:MAG: two-component regulator propeller domain-containing protein [Edaphobacter sp.]